MPDPVIAHVEAIHITAASVTALSDANKLEEMSKFDLPEEAELVERKNLNSDGYTKVTAAWRSLSGSLDFKVVSGSTTQALIAAGATAYVSVITAPEAASGDEKGRRYQVVFGNVTNSWEAGGLKGGTASFKVNGAPTSIVAT